MSYLKELAAVGRTSIFKMISTFDFYYYHCCLVGRTSIFKMISTLSLILSGMYEVGRTSIFKMISTGTGLLQRGKRLDVPQFLR